MVLIGREDADECGGSFGVEGLVNYLLCEGKELLQKYVFKIIPMVGIDGVIAGVTHSAGYGYSGKNWHKKPAPDEIENAKNAIRKWVAIGGELVLAGKLRGLLIQMQLTVLTIFLPAMIGFAVPSIEVSRSFSEEIGIREAIISILSGIPIQLLSV